MRFLILCLIPFCVAAAPKVLKTVPENGKQDVDPATPELRVIFDQPMRTGGRSVVNSSRGVFPELVGPPRWEDNNKTFVWKMKLEPNTDYWLSINATRFTNFRNANGEPAVPYPIAFSTRGSEKPASPEQIKANQEAIAKLKKIILEDYSYFDLRKVDWEKQFVEFSPKLEAAGGPGEFATVAAKMLRAAQDIHLSMRAGERRIYTHKRDVFPAVNFRLLQRLVPQWTRRHDFVYSGVYPDGTRYLCITTLPAQDAAYLLAI
ncbi:MAG TPA: Ig-like domain-containing protein, partial [Tepidisphaeraceae bacterium]|nr:Ig-like domain-containing protein [Tepidisphaeraceae bacterium]